MRRHLYETLSLGWGAAKRVTAIVTAMREASGLQSPLTQVVLVIGLVASLLFSIAPSFAQGNSLTLSVRAGFEGYYKDGRWMPVRITVANDGVDTRGTLHIEAPRNDGTTVTFSREVQLPTLSRRELFMYVPMEGYISNLNVVLVNRQGSALAQQSVRVNRADPVDLLYGVIANSPSTFNILGDVTPISGVAYVAQLELADLPPADQGWQSLDALVISDVDTGTLTPEQRAALAAWVANGGRLMVAGGPGWQKTSAGLGDVLPLNPSGTRTLGNFNALAVFAGAPTPEGSGVVAIGPLAEDAVVWVNADGQPLIASRQLGFGQITFLAADPAFEPLKGWDGLEPVFRNIMSVSAERPSWAGGMRNWYSAREAVNALPGLSLPSIWQICGFLALYIIVIGPLNYLILQRLKRRELAWLTIPAIVVVFSAGTYITGYQLRGTDSTLHRLAIVQVWPDSEWARVDAVIGLFSPRRTGYNLEFAEGYLVRPMPSDGSLGSPAAKEVIQGDVTRVNDVRVDVGAVQAFVAQGKTAAPRFASTLTLDFGASTSALTGTVTNASDLTLKQAVLLAPGTSQPLGDFAPGATKDITLYLSGARASPTPANSVAPSFSAVLPPGGYYAPSYYDRTIEEIMGTSSYYDNKELFRQYSLLTSIMDPYGGTARGGGVYLVGWTDDAPVGAQVLNRSFSTVDQSVYIIALSPTINQGPGALTLPPGLMNYTVLDPGSIGAPTPYDMYLDAGFEYALRFAPTHPISFNRVTALTFRVTSFGAGGSPAVNFYLWDFTEGTWVQQAPVVWGDNLIASPERFVSPASEIHLRVVNPPGSSYVNLEATDFTLVVER